MVDNDMKIYINELHVNLTNVFGKENVKIDEKSDKKFGSYFRIDVNKDNYLCVIILPKKEICKKVFTYKYLANPFDDKSTVERDSTLDMLADDINDIFDHKRFNAEYLNK